MSTRQLTILILLSFFSVLGAQNAEAQARKRTTAPSTPRLMMPAACTPGQNCWIVNHVDMVAEENDSADFTCGPKTYDGHEGTDFGLRDSVAMNEGVSVLAAAPGKVLRVRDSIPDAQPTPEQIDRMLAENRGCGNGVLIDHGNGWQSIYCHLKKGSILVTPESSVTPGQKIAEIGQSGAAEFPHLHFGLFHNNETIDPFSGTPAKGGCGNIKQAMWDIGLNIDYDPISIFAGGFSSGVPDFDVIREDAQSPEKMGPAIDALTFWAGIYGLHDGDIVHMDIIAPDDSVFATQTITQDSRRARQFYYVGRRIGDPLLPGRYKGVVRVTRSIDGGNANVLKREMETILTITNPVDDARREGFGGTLLP